MKQYLICINDTFCLVLDQKDLICPQNYMEVENFNDQNTHNLSKNESFEVSCNYNERYDMYHIAKVLIQLIYRDMIQSRSNK